MEEKKTPASAAESAAPERQSAVPAAELRPGRRKFPTVGDLFAMLGIAFGAQIVVGTAAMVLSLIHISVSALTRPGRNRCFCRWVCNAEYGFRR